MGNERKEIILDEIKYWKQSKLLPTEYCDFLIMLYTEGEGVTEKTESKRKQRGSLRRILDIIFLLLLIPVFIYVILFYDLSIDVKMLITLGMLILTGIHYYVYKKSNTVYVHLPIILFFLVLLVGTFAFVQSVSDSSLFIQLTILLHCFIWLMFGYWKRLYYLIASGIIGVILLMVSYIVI
ncbi:hypothetical protein [Tenuibacillus multivorans]|uniref:Uncharacterized protein n=1 Tax=Tenuibacillus multivorans TaxID=237069 RepID=A0A1G9ZCG8_9BACI|nr:hypothetical protein [Tenuibacillus multivorans]GEL78304.1 hypothetical protein TMU01_25390 [Tenuibacillus multivorans]SDN18964.1 hypothetical protein SAMN05216498_1636 [Tenuibacillus multivorans]